MLQGKRAVIFGAGGSIGAAVASEFAAEGAEVFLAGRTRSNVEAATAIGTAFGAIESLTENLAVEVSPFGVRVVCLRTTANTDSRTMQQTMDAVVSKMHITKEQALAGMANLNFLKVPATVSDTAKAAVLLASDRARLLTGTVFNSTAGAALD